MQRQLYRVAIAILCTVLSAYSLAKLPEAEDADVQYLLGFVESSACNFTRNGSTHTPQKAADHLRLKYRRGGRHVNTAEEFIDKLASASSWTGKKYTVNCAGQVYDVGPWLHEALTAHRDAQNKKP